MLLPAALITARSFAHALPARTSIRFDERADKMMESTSLPLIIGAGQPRKVREGAPETHAASAA